MTFVVFGVKRQPQCRPLPPSPPPSLVRARAEMIMVMVIDDYNDDCRNDVGDDDGRNKGECGDGERSLVVPASTYQWVS